MKNVPSPIRTFRKSMALVLGFFLTLNLSAQTPWVDEMLKKNANFSTIKQAFDLEWDGKQYVKGKGWKQYQRWQAFWETRLLADGSFPDFKNSFHEYQQYMSVNGQAKSLQNAGNWSPMGPFSYSNTDSWSPGLGRVNFVVEDPNNASIIYIGAPAGGVWKSIDAGATWTPLGDDLAVMGISAIAISAANSNVLYVATGDADGGDTYSIGVLKSTDGGLTWAEVGNVGGNLRDIVVDPADEDIVYVASNGGVYKTIDGGTTWNQVLVGSIRDLELKPGTASTIYAATSGQVRYSTDSGGTWTLATGIPTGSSRIGLAVTPANNAYVYVLLADGSGDYGGIHRSTDSGVSFSPRNTNTDVFEGSSQSWYDMAIGASATNAEVIFTGVLNVWRSTNGGTNLTQLNSWSNPGGASYTHADIHFLRGYGGKIYCGSDGGVYRSTNDGASFTDITDGIQISQFYRIGGSKNDVTTIAGGLQDNGGYVYNNATWKVYYGADGMEAAISPVNSNIIYGMIQNGNLYRSTNGGNSSQGLSRPEAGRWVTPMQFDPNANRVVAGYNDLYEYNGGWNQLSTFNFPELLRSIEFYDANSSVIYVSTNDQIYRTLNNGAGFSEVTNNLSGILAGNIITSIEVDPTDSSRVWVSIGGFTDGTKVAYTADGGANWSNVSGTLPNLPCNVVKFESTSTVPNALYVGMDIGVYYSDDVLGDFIPFMVNLPNVIVNDLELNEASGMIRAGSYGRGVWESGSYSISVLSDDAGIADVSHPTGSFCGDTFVPEVTLRNYGTTALTQVTINYQVGSGTVSTFNWTGSLTSWTSLDVSLPSVTAGGQNEFKVWTSMPNGIVDVNLQNDSVIVNYNGISNGIEIYTQLIEDCWGSECTWEIIDATGIPQFAGGPYSDGNGQQLNLDSVCLSAGCYDFIINDSYGDGLSGASYASCGADGDYYVISNANDTLVQMGVSNFGSQATHNFCVTVPNFADFSWNGTNFCANETVTFTDASQGATTWSWDFGVGASPATATGAGPHVVTYNSGGTKTIGLNTNGGAQTSSQTVTINALPSAPSIASSGATTFCDGNSITLTSSEVGGNDWSTNETADAIVVNSTGTYSLIYTDGNGCAASSAPVSVVVNSNPTIGLGTVTDPSVCAAATGTVELTGSGTGDVSWSGSTTGSVTGISLPYTATGFAAGFYNLIYTDGNGCSSTSQSASLSDPTPPATPVISTGGATTFCEGGSVQLTSSATNGNTWSTSATSSIITVTTSGSYGVTVTEFGCSATSAPIAIVVNPNPTIPMITADGGITEVCLGDSVVLSSSYASSNEWSNLETTETITVITTGDFDVTYTDGNGCSSTSILTLVVVNSLPVVNAGGDQEVCDGEVVTLSGSGANTYSWTNSVVDGTPFTPGLGTTTYEVVGTDANGCANIDDVDVVVNPLPSVDFTLGQDTTCVEAGSVTLTGSPVGGTFSGTGVSGNIFDPSTSGEGQFVIEYSFTDANGCSEIETQTIVVEDCSSLLENELANVQVYPNPTSGEFTIQLDGDFSYEVHDARGRIIQVGNGLNITEVDLVEAEAGIYFLHITNSIGQKVVRVVKN
ncbi:MAG: hypothetical protein COA38_15240 [Fluviicola sp.]|nr:MAG: hypothetical protein COA38_15240 [Fluviicola sp.]